LQSRRQLKDLSEQNLWKLLSSLLLPLPVSCLSAACDGSPALFAFQVY
jgi:hypothetical protein